MYKQQKCIARGSGGWEAQDQEPGRFGVRGRLPICFKDDIFYLSPCVAEGVDKLPSGLFYKGTIHLLKALPFNTVTLGIKFQYMNFGGHTHPSAWPNKQPDAADSESDATPDSWCLSQYTPWPGSCDCSPQDYPSIE